MSSGSLFKDSTKSKNKLKRINLRTSLVLSVELFERISYYSLIANLVLCCQARFHFGNVNSIVISFAFLGFCNMLPIFIIWFTNSKTGKFNTLFGSFFVYLIGTSLMLYLIYDKNQLSINYGKLFFMISLLLISFGSAAAKSVVSSFGVEQISISRNENKHYLTILKNVILKKYFKLFFHFINISSFLSFVLISYVQTFNIFYGFIPITSAIFLCCIIMSLGSCVFICRPPDGSYMTDIVRVIVYAYWRKKNHGKEIKKDLPGNMSLDFLDYAHVLYGGKYTTSQVDIVKCTGRIMIVLSSMVVFWTVFYQMSTTFIVQGQHMNLKLFDNFKIPASSLCAINTITLILVSFLLKHLLWPCFRKLNIALTVLRKMGAGMICAVLAMVAAGLTETYRKTFLEGSNTNVFGGLTFNASSLTVAFQVPQYVFIGVSEVLTSISGLEFAYSQTPKFLQNLVIGLFLASSGLGCFLSSVIVKLLSIYTNWFGEDINNFKFEYYFYFLAGLLFLNFIYFIIIANRYSYVDDYFTGTSKAVSNAESASECSLPP